MALRERWYPNFTFEVPHMLAETARRTLDFVYELRDDLGPQVDSPSGAAGYGSSAAPTPLPSTATPGNCSPALCAIKARRAWRWPCSRQPIPPPPASPSSGLSTPLPTT
jgi:hypothetical protein